MPIGSGDLEPLQIFRPTPETVHWGYFDASLKSIGRVRDGEVFVLQSVSAFADDPEPDLYIHESARAIFDSGIPRGPGPHLLTGPLWVEGARPGDVLQIDVQAIRLSSPYGYNLLHPFRGLLPAHVDRLERAIIPIDVKAGTAEPIPGLVAPTDPFFGILGVAPPSGWGRIDSQLPHRHGGNLDCKELRAGSSLFLPVAVQGALFSAGDGHAAQGDGEVNLTALETSLEGEFRLVVRRGLDLAGPVAISPTHLLALGLGEDLNEAARSALDLLLNLLCEMGGLDRSAAYRLASMCADLHITQVVNGIKGVHAMLPLALVEQLPHRITLLDRV